MINNHLIIDAMAMQQVKARYANRCEMQKAALTRKRELIRRNHELMVEMDHRWNIAKRKR